VPVSVATSALTCEPVYVATPSTCSATATPPSPNYTYEIPRYVEHLVGYLDAQGIESARFVGESLVGWVAGWLASEQPARVRSLQLVAAGGTVANPAIMERIKSSTTRAVVEDDIDFTRARLHLLMHDNIAGSRLVVLEKCGHWPQHEQHDQFNKLSIEFITTAELARS
jgi:pimeloyl-ACP methyl ester carboxylesterase